MKTYCSKSAAGTSYNMQKPKFCQSCGSPFGKKIVAQTKRKPQKPALVDEEKRAELIDTEDFRLSENVNKLEFDMIGSLKVKGTTVGTIAGTLDPENIEKRTSDVQPKITEEQFLEDFRREAGTSRPNR